ncbi:MAG: Fic family protein [Termitinemataceae bacterium]|nr:MAG: Fic family protein [Termitinemataceae bacterium]
MAEYEYTYIEHRIAGATSIEGTENYCYPNTTILRNKQGIKDDEALTVAEREISSLRILQLRSQPTEGNFDLDHLCQIHRFIFNDIYEWAGNLRHGEFLSKGGSIFCRGQFLKNNSDEIFAKLLNENQLRNLPKEQFVKRLAFYMGEVNALHPFREGNGRTAREFFRQLSFAAGYTLDFGNTHTDDLLKADIDAFNGAYTGLVVILDKAVT